MQDFAEQHSRQRRLFRGFQHHGTARRQRRDHLERDLVHRPVPRRDQRANADGFVDDMGVLVAGTQRGFELVVFQRVNKTRDMIGSSAGLLHLGHINGCAHFGADRRAHLVRAAHVDVIDGLQQLQTFRLGRQTPLGKGRLCRRHSGLCIRRPAEGNNGHSLFGRGVDHVEIAPFQRGDPSAVDIVIACVLHGVAFLISVDLHVFIMACRCKGVFQISLCASRGLPLKLLCQLLRHFQRAGRRANRFYGRKHLGRCHRHVLEFI